MLRPMVRVAEVLVEVPARAIDRTFDYVIPTYIEHRVEVGSRVIVPFGPRKTQGYVLGIHEGPDPSHPESEQKLKPLEQVLDETPPLTEELIELGKWMSREYTCLTITALQAMLPSVLKSRTEKIKISSEQGNQQVVYQVKDKVTIKEIAVVQLNIEANELEHKINLINPRAVKQKEVLRYLAEMSLSRSSSTKSRPFFPVQQVLDDCQTTRATLKSLEESGLILLSKQQINRDPFAHRDFKQTQPLPLTREQGSVIHHIKDAVDRKEFCPFLMHGVTGSGKTELYLQSISYVLDRGKEAIVLVPEISLTPQMVERFKGRFGDRVAVLHSRLSQGERYDEWRKIREGRVMVVIGARSALFAPFRQLGLIIIDEEHESSYKQEETPKYHARDIAMFRAQYHQVPVILGSATPSLESYARAQKGVYQLLTLKERIFGQQLPPVTVVDMRQELHDGNRTMFSRALFDKINDCLAKKEQMVLFLNRRGFSTFVMCRDCGYVLQCPHCDISLTYHKSNPSHRCHYCGYTQNPIQQCPECSSEHIRFFGTGTQKVEEELEKHFPGIRVIRMDVDTTQRKGSHERLLQKFGAHEADCLLGTQMIAKGLDFKKVTLVGVITADSLLHLPDFRAAEKTFQLLTQVSGRAGRHQLPGEVIVQTYTPEHYSITAAAEHDYATFYKQEMLHRKQRGYPPYFYITLLKFVHEDLTFLVKESERAAAWLKQHVSPNTIVLGPVASAVPRIKDRYRYQCMLKYKDEQNLGNILAQFLVVHKDLIDKHQMQIQIDRNPQMLM